MLGESRRSFPSWHPLAISLSFWPTRVTIISPFLANISLKYLWTEVLPLVRKFLGFFLGFSVQKQPATPNLAHKFHNKDGHLQFPVPPMTKTSNSPCQRCQPTRSRQHLPCVCSPHSPPGTLPPPSTPMDCDDNPGLRRVSFDSNASIFSRISLTASDSASLEAWERATLATSPSPSEPKSVGKSTSRRWVVFFGRNPGVYKT